MKDFIIRLAIFTSILLILPAIFVVVFKFNNTKNNTDKFLKIYDYQTKEIFQLSLDDYIYGVVSAEMPASFHPEALKAQAIASRTYVLNKLNELNEDHEDADICTDPSHCQAYASDDELKSSWGKKYKEYSKKIRNAVHNTDNEYIEFNNKPINAVFHSCSNGKTENASDVWNGNCSYLISVESPGDIKKKDYISNLVITKDDFIKILEKELGKQINREVAPIGKINKTTGDNIKDIEFFGVVFSATDIRRMFGLKSTAFDVTIENNDFIFCVYGNGHGVGMSQYGANDFANSGYDCNEILGHYYSGTKIAVLK